jgi:hypothetical protein
MRRLLSLLGERFTHIVIDSPPDHLVHGRLDPLDGGRRRDARRPRRSLVARLVRRAKQQLVDVGANIFGIVLNNVKLESTDYYYYSGYYRATTTKAATTRRARPRPRRRSALDGG